MEEITKSYAIKRIAELNEEILQLRTDLLDKETELAKFKIKDTYGLSDFIDMNSKKLAISELENVKKWVVEYSDLKGQNWSHTLNYLNKRINELKEL